MFDVWVVVELADPPGLSGSPGFTSSVFVVVVLLCSTVVLGGAGDWAGAAAGVGAGVSTTVGAGAGDCWHPVPTNPRENTAVAKMYLGK